MTRRERLERRARRRREWAEKRREKADRLREANEPFRGDVAFNTQPGHIPERKRVIRRTEKAVEHSEMARHHERRADGIEEQLERSIYSDDPDAVERLEERIAELEAERKRIKHINREIRKGDGWSKRIDPPITDDERADLEMSARFTGKAGYPPYKLKNLGANIRRNRQRLEELRQEPSDG